MTSEQTPKVPSLRTQLLAAAREYSVYLPEPLEPEDCDELMHILEPVVTKMLAARERAVWDKLRTYQQMRISMSDQSRCVEVLAGNIVKEAVENGAIAELRGLETWINQQAQAVKP